MGSAGSGKGSFFGPGAQELGGQFQATDAFDTYDGVFWGAR